MLGGSCGGVGEGEWSERRRAWRSLREGEEKDKRGEAAAAASAVEGEGEAAAEEGEEGRVFTQGSHMGEMDEARGRRGRRWEGGGAEEARGFVRFPVLELRGSVCFGLLCYGRPTTAFFGSLSFWFWVQVFEVVRFGWGLKPRRGALFFSFLTLKSLILQKNAPQSL